MSGREFGRKDPNTTSRTSEEVCLVAKKVIDIVKLQIPAGKANPAPPVGPALGQAGINIMGFCKEFNAQTQDQAGLIIPVKTYPLWLKLFAELLPISNLLDWILSKNFLDQGLLIIIAKLFAWYIICLTSSRIKQKAF